MTAIPVIVGLSSSIVFLALLFKLAQRNRSHRQEFGVPSESAEEWSDQWFDEYSSFRYLPMRRLLSSDEEEFWMESTGGGEPNRSSFRSERRRLFRQYLRLIAADFGRLSKGVRLSVVHAAADQSAEIERLFQLEWTFRKLLWKAHAGLMFHWLGVKPVDATELINALQGFEFSLREIRTQTASV
jgi:hypothetical protein